MKGLTEKRKEHKLTMRELGKRIGVTTKTVYNYEADKTSPNIKTLQEIASIFNCTVDELL